MTNKIKISLCIFLISYFAVIKPAQAFLPLIYAAIVGAVDATAALTTTQAIGSALIGVGAAALIGQRIGVLSINGKDSNNNDLQINIPLTNLPRDRPISNPSLAASQPIVSNPITIHVCPTNYSDIGQCANYGSCTYQRSYTYTSTSATDCSVTQTNSGAPANNQYGIVNDSYTAYGIPKNYICNPSIATGSPNGAGCQLNAGAEPESCPTGYTKASGICALTAPQAVPDKKIGFKLDANNNFSVDTTDGDFDPALQTNDFSYSDGAIAFKIAHPTYVDGYRPGYWSGSDSLPAINVQISDSMASSGASGTSSCPYQTCTPVPGLPGHFRISAISNTSTGEGRQVAIDVNKTTGIVTQAVVVPLSGTVISAGQTYVNTAGATVVVPAGQLAVVNASGATYVQAPAIAVAPAAVNISIPTDYARAGEATIAAKSITDKLAETTEETDLVEPVLSNPLSNYFNPLRSWAMPVASGSCPAGSFSWNGNSYSFNIMCTLFESYLTMIQGGMNVVYSLAALFIVLGA